MPLAPLTTLELGGAARHLVEIESFDAAVEAVRWARAQQLEIAVLGGGSNLVVADRGFEGLVLRVVSRGLEMTRDRDDVVVTVAAGEPWDELVGLTVDEGIAGIECLSGIPGTVGATPVQNVGAYGQEVGAVIESVRVLELDRLEERNLPAADCGFRYRASRFRERPGDYLVLQVSYRLRLGGPPPPAYDELRRALAVSGPAPSLDEVRETVLALRRAKSMVIDADDGNRRSVGSFFVNPVVDAQGFEGLVGRAREGGIVAEEGQVPAHPVAGGLFKIPAGWLVERAGFERGLRRGSVGISSKHALALVHHGGGTTAALLALAREIREGVAQRFGIRLEPEPVFLGFDTANPLDR